MCASRASPQAIGPARRRGERRDISPVAVPGGRLSRVRPQADGGWFNWGLMSIHGPGRMGEGPNSRPRRFLLAMCGVGGYADFRFPGGEQPPVAKPRRPHRAVEPPQIWGPLGAYGDLWGPMGAFGDLWGPMGAYGDLWGHMGTYGDLWGLVGTYAGLWRPMGVYADQWGPMGTYGGLWGPLGAYGGHWDLWGPMGTFGGLWGPMGAYGAL